MKNTHVHVERTKYRIRLQVDIPRSGGRRGIWTVLTAAVVGTANSRTPSRMHRLPSAECRHKAEDISAITSLAKCLAIESLDVHTTSAKTLCRHKPLCYDHIHERRYRDGMNVRIAAFKLERA